MRQLILDIRPDAVASFDNFLAGDNGEVLAAVRAHAAGDLTEPVLYLWGDAGVGKTHLLHAWAGVSGATVGLPVDGDAPVCLAVDDVERLDDGAQRRLFTLVNSAREGAGRLLVCAGAPPAGLALRADLATRLAQGLVFRVRALSEQDRLEALHARARARGLPLPDEVARYLLIHGRRDLPHLLAMVDLLDRHSLSHKRPVTLPLARDLLARGTS